MPFAPVGIYDFTNRLVTTVESDFNGFYDVLLPSTNHISCPTPSGVCANMYRFVGNDPGVPGALNPNYNPRFRTIATEFEAMPGRHHPDRPRTDPGRASASSTPGTEPARRCHLPGQRRRTPQLFAVLEAVRPYSDTAASRTFTINGTRLRRHQGHRPVTLDGVALPTHQPGPTRTIDVDRAQPRSARRRAAPADDHRGATASRRSTA